MSLETNVRLDETRGIYVYYLVHDGAEIPLMERKAGGVDKRRKAAADRASEQTTSEQQN